MDQTNGAGDTSNEVDIDASMDITAADLGLTPSDEPETPAEPGDEPVVPVGEPPADPTQEPTAKPMPKSWGKDKAEIWSSLTPAAQDYYTQREQQFHEGIEQYKGAAQYARAMDEAIAPYRASIAAMGVNEVEGVKYLLNAQYRLTNGTPESRHAAFLELGRDLGFVAKDGELEARQLDPAMKSLLARLERVESTEVERQRKTEQEIRTASENETNAFWADPENIYVEEVGHDMVPLVRAGMDLKEAYKRAVWGNPVTREKELARRDTDARKKLLDDAKKEGTAARNATRLNVRGAESRKAPTEPKGTMEDTMRATLKEIRSRE